MLLASSEWFYSTKVYKAWTRFVGWFASIMVRVKPPAIKAVHIRSAIQLIQPGDIILRKYNCYVDKYFIKGKYTHSGIVHPEQKETLFHTDKDFIRCVDIIDFLKDCDGFMIIRFKNINIERLVKVTALVLGLPYDYLFNKQLKNAFYCHELSEYVLEQSGVEFKSKPGNIIYAEDLINNCHEIVYNSKTL